MLPLDVLPEPIGARPCVSTAIRTYNLRKALGDVALVPAAANNFAHKSTDTGLEPGVYIRRAAVRTTLVTETITVRLPLISWIPGGFLLKSFDLDAVQQLTWCRPLQRELTIPKSRKLCEHAACESENRQSPPCELQLLNCHPQRHCTIPSSSSSDHHLC